VTSEIPAHVMNQCSILVEIVTAFLEFRPKMIEGFFYTSNMTAFAIATDIREGILTNPKDEWLQLVSEAVADFSAITAQDLQGAKHLGDLKVGTEQILNDIESYDNLTEDATP